MQGPLKHRYTHSHGHIIVIRWQAEVLSCSYVTFYCNVHISLKYYM